MEPRREESPTPLPDGGLHQRVAFQTHQSKTRALNSPEASPPPLLAAGVSRHERATVSEGTRTQDYRPSL